jgi:hypothetical protein
MMLSTIAVLACTTLGPQGLPDSPVNLSNPAGFIGHGARRSLTIHPDRSRIYSDGGSVVTILDPNYVPQASVAMDAPIWSLVVDDRDTADYEDDLLFVAGGQFGVLQMRIARSLEAVADPSAVRNMAAFEVQVIDDSVVVNQVQTDANNTKICTDVALVSGSTSECPEGDDWLVATFAAKDDSELRVYRWQSASGVCAPGKYEFEFRIPLINGTSNIGQAFALAVDRTTVYVAMGEGGLLRINLDEYACQGVTLSTLIQKGPKFPNVTGAGFENFGPDTRSIAHDLAIVSVEGIPKAGDTSTFLYVAADAFGLGEVNVTDTEPWNSNTTIHQATTLTGLHGFGDYATYKHSYGFSVDAIADADGSAATIAVSGLDMDVGNAIFQYRFTIEPYGHFVNECHSDVRRGRNGLYLFRRDASGLRATANAVEGVTSPEGAISWIELEPDLTNHVRIHTIDGSLRSGHSQVLKRRDKVDPESLTADLTIDDSYGGLGSMPTGAIEDIVDHALLYLSGEGLGGTTRFRALRMQPGNFGQPSCVLADPVAPGSWELVPELPFGAAGIINDNGAQWTSGSDHFMVSSAKGQWRVRELNQQEEWYARPELALPLPPEPSLTRPVRSPPIGRLGSARYFENVLGQSLVLGSRITCGHGVFAFYVSRIERSTGFVPAYTPAPIPPSPKGCTEFMNFPARLYRLENPCYVSAGFEYADNVDASFVQAFEGLTHPELGPTFDRAPDRDWWDRGTKFAVDTTKLGNCNDELVELNIEGRAKTWSPRVFTQGDPSATNPALIMITPSHFDVRQFRENGAGGFEINPNYKRPQVIFHDISSATGVPLFKLADWEPFHVEYPSGGSDEDQYGAAIAVEIVKVASPLGWSDYAFVADTRGRLHVLDVSNVSVNTSAALVPGMTWESPPYSLTGDYDPVFDVAVELADEGSGESTDLVIYAYVGATHGGVFLVRYDVDEATGALLSKSDLGFAETPGQALTSVNLSTVSGSRRLFVGDRSIRFYE